MAAMRLYTRTGDDGTTGLFGGGRVAKDHPRVDAYGAVDELNACLGFAAAEVNNELGRIDDSKVISPSGSPGAREGYREFLKLVQSIFVTLQSRLFDVGADLATPEGSKHEARVMRLGAAQIEEAERWIDQIDAGNAPMKHFVLPGGTELSARLHLARTVCRRAERAMVHLTRSEPVTPGAIVYINRVSDLLFAMARRANKEAGIEDVPWRPEGSKDA